MNKPDSSSEAQHLSVKSSALNVERSASAADADSPWPGLATFTEEQAGLFHGRDAEIRDLTKRTERNALTVLFGQSGLGKSSLLQAGVFPRLRANSYWPIYVRLDHSPGAPPPAEQIKALVQADTVRAGRWTAPGSAKPGESLWEFFHHRDDRLVSPAGRIVVPVLVFDQFEELFTLGAGSGSERARAFAFMSELAELVENRPSEKLVARLEDSSAEMDAFDFSRTEYRVVITLREDYLPHLESLKTAMPALMENRMRLARMTGTQALEAVVKPGGALVTEEVARAIVEFVAGAKGGSIERLAELDVEPPLLSVICRELNERRRALGQAQITADLVSGNRREILTDFYERSVGDLPEAMRCFVEDRLLTKSGFRDNLALETALEEPGVTQPLIDTLVSRRLLRIEDRLGVQRVELTHDVLAEVIRASRDARQQRLLLAEAQQREEQARVESARRTRRMRFAIGGLAGVIVALCIGAVFGLRAQRRAAADASRTDLILGSRLLDEGKLSEGLAYLVRAGRKDPTNPFVAPRLLTTLAANNFSLPVAPPLRLPSPAASAEYSADGKRVFVQGDDNRVSIVDAEHWQVERTLDFGQDVCYGGLRLAAKNSGLFAVALADNTIHICDPATGKSCLELKPGERLAGRTPTFEISPNGRWLAARTTGNFWLWDTASGEVKFKLDATAPQYAVLAFSPGSDRLVASLGSGSIATVLSVPDGGTLVDRITQKFDARSFAWIYFSNFSADGRKLLMRFSNGITIFDPASGERLHGPIAVTASDTDDAFLNHDGSRLIYVASDRTVNVVDLASGKPVFPPLAHGSRIVSARLDSSGRILLTSLIDGGLRLWDMETGKPLAEPSFKRDRYVPAALAPDGKSLAIFSDAAMGHQVRRGSGAAAPLILPRDSNVLMVGVFPEAPTRLVWLTAAGVKSVDASSGREATGSYAFPAPITGPQTIRSTYGQVFGRGQALAVQIDDNDPTRTWRAYLIGDRGVEKAVMLAEVPSEVWHFNLNPTGNLASSAGRSSTNKTTGIWNLTTGKLVRTFTAEKAISNRDTTISPNEKLVAYVTTEDSVVHVCDIASGQERFALRLSGKASLGTFRFSAQGNHLLTGDDWGGVQVWDMTTGRPLHSRQVHRSAVRRFDFSNDGRFYVSLSNNGTAQVWEMATHDAVGQLLEQPGTATRADFGPAGTRIATISADSTRAWDVVSGHALTPPMHHPGETVGVVAYGPDGKFIQTFSSRGASKTIWVWAAPPETGGGRTPSWVLDLATICAGRRVTDEGKIVSAETDWGKMGELRRIIAELPENDRLAEWGRWLLSDSPQRPIAPGFTVTPAEAEAQRASMAANAEAIAAAAADDAALNTRSNQLYAEERWPEAEIAIRQNLARITQRSAPESRAIVFPTFRLASSLWHQKKFDDAEPVARTAVRLAEKLNPAGATPIAITRGILGRVLLGQRRFAEAEPLLVSTYPALTGEPQRLAAEGLVELYTATNNPTKLAEWQKIVAEVPAATVPATNATAGQRTNAPTPPKAGKKKAN